MSKDKKNKDIRPSVPKDTSESGTEGKKISARELAGKLYDLDKLVYELSGSSLGRVFTNDRERNVTIIEKALNENGEHIIRSELALIGNMARSIQDEEDHYRALSAYNELFNEFREIAAHPGTLVASERDVQLNELNLHNRFSRKDRLIICINRTYGSAANNVGLGIASVAWGFVNDVFGYGVTFELCIVALVLTFVVAFLMFPKGGEGRQ